MRSTGPGDRLRRALPRRGRVGDRDGEGRAPLAPWLRWLMLVPLLLVTLVVVRQEVPAVTSSADPVSSSPPPDTGWFRTLPAGSWTQLPDDRTCTERVRRSTWEPRPDNHTPNRTTPDVETVHASFAARPRAVAGGYDDRWDSWLLQRVTGAHTGTTDENIQWAACKWGIADNLLRAIAVRESAWFQYQVYPSGRCVAQVGCGDMTTGDVPGHRLFCTAVSRHGYDYRQDYPAGVCPKTYSIVGVMSWHDPRWGPMPENQNGTFPFNRDSTAFALDYLGAFLRGCQEGWLHWLGNTGDGSYAAGETWGCVGAWYAGSWLTPPAREYVGRVRAALDDRAWLTSDWAAYEPPCSPAYGCPRGR